MKKIFNLLIVHKKQSKIYLSFKIHNSKFGEDIDVNTTMKKILSHYRIVSLEIIHSFKIHSFTH